MLGLLDRHGKSLEVRANWKLTKSINYFILRKACTMSKSDLLGELFRVGMKYLTLINKAGSNEEKESLRQKMEDEINSISQKAKDMDNSRCSKSRGCDSRNQNYLRSAPIFGRCRTIAPMTEDELNHDTSAIASEFMKLNDIELAMIELEIQDNLSETHNPDASISGNHVTGWVDRLALVGFMTVELAFRKAEKEKQELSSKEVREVDEVSEVVKQE